jgi:hypothetical protein
MTQQTSLTNTVQQREAGEKRGTARDFASGEKFKATEQVEAIRQCCIPVDELKDLSAKIKDILSAGSNANRDLVAHVQAGLEKLSTNHPPYLIGNDHAQWSSEISAIISLVRSDSTPFNVPNTLVTQLIAIVSPHLTPETRIAVTSPTPYATIKFEQGPNSTFLTNGANTTPSSGIQQVQDRVIAHSPPPGSTVSSSVTGERTTASSSPVSGEATVHTTSQPKSSSIDQQNESKLKDSAEKLDSQTASKEISSQKELVSRTFEPSSALKDQPTSISTPPQEFRAVMTPQLSANDGSLLQKVGNSNNFTGASAQTEDKKASEVSAFPISKETNRGSFYNSSQSATPQAVTAQAPPQASITYTTQPRMVSSVERQHSSPGNPFTQDSGFKNNLQYVQKSSSSRWSGNNQPNSMKTSTNASRTNSSGQGGASAFTRRVNQLSDRSGTGKNIARHTKDVRIARNLTSSPSNRLSARTMGSIPGIRSELLRRTVNSIVQKRRDSKGLQLTKETTQLRSSIKKTSLIQNQTQILSKLTREMRSPVPTSHSKMRLISQELRKSLSMSEKTSKLLHRLSGLPIKELRALLSVKEAKDKTQRNLASNDRRQLREISIYVKNLLSILAQLLSPQSQLYKRVTSELSISDLELLVELLAGNRARKGLKKKISREGITEITLSEITSDLISSLKRGEAKTSARTPTVTNPLMDQTEGIESDTETESLAEGEFTADGATPKATLTTVLIKEEALANT